MCLSPESLNVHQTVHLKKTPTYFNIKFLNKDKPLSKRKLYLNGQQIRQSNRNRNFI